MIKHIKIIIITCVISLGFLACEEENIATYSGKDVIYFQWAVEGYRTAKIDSTSITFAFELPSQVTDSLVEIPVKVQGFTSTNDRSVNVKVLEESTAQLGVHYSMPDNITIPANSVIGYIPITFNRTADMKDEVFSLKLQLLENESFETTLWGTDKSSNADRLLSYTEFEVTVSDILTEPDRWFMLSGWLGTFSAKKLYLLAEVNEIPIPNYNELPNIVEFFGHVAVMKAYLAAQKQAGTPVLEEDGTEMTLGRFA